MQEKATAALAHSAKRRSELKEVQVAVDVLPAVVPEEEPLGRADSLDPPGHEPDYILKMAIEKIRLISTYLLPVGTWPGLTSAALKAAKKSSTGAAS